MIWHDGLILIWQLHGSRFKSWRTHIKLYFLVFLAVAWIWKGWRKTL